MKTRIEGIQQAPAKLSRRRKAKGYSRRDLQVLREHASTMNVLADAKKWKLVSFHSRRRRSVWENKNGAVRTIYEIGQLAVSERRLRLSWMVLP